MHKNNKIKVESESTKGDKFDERKILEDNGELKNKIDKLINILDKRRVAELIELLDNKKELVLRNFLAGISKGIGTGIGFTVLTSIIIYILQKIIRLNIPVIGEYVKDIVDIAQRK